MGQLWCQRDRE